MKIEENRFKYRRTNNDRVIEFMNLLNYEERTNEFESYLKLSYEGYKNF